MKTYSPGVMNILDKQADLYPYAGPGHWNDPDMLGGRQWRHDNGDATGAAAISLFATASVAA